MDKGTIKLEHHEFVVDGDVDSTESDAIKFWLDIYNMKSPMGEYKYRNLATCALILLSIPASDADCERVFSQVRRIKTDFRSSLSTETIIGCHFNKMSKCCELTTFEESLLVRAKQYVVQKVNLIISQPNNYCFYISFKLNIFLRFTKILKMA